jgi:hypothetical protein
MGESGYRAADADGMRALAREIDDAADAVAGASRAARAAVVPVCRDLGCVPGSLATVVFALRDHADSLRSRAAALSCTAVPERPGGVTFTIPPPTKEHRAEWGHFALDALGFIPLYGAIPDAVNALWYAAEGDGLDALLSAAAVVPVFGDAAAVPKFVGKSADEVAVLLRDVKDGERVFDVADLYANEAKAGAHVIEKHVGKTYQELLGRATRESQKFVSSFVDDVSAAHAIDTALRANVDEVVAVASGALRQATISAPVRAGLGAIVTGAGAVLPATHVRAVVRATDDGTVIVTAFLEAL